MKMIIIVFLIISFITANGFVSTRYNRFHTLQYRTTTATAQFRTLLDGKKSEANERTYTVREKAVEAPSECLLESLEKAKGIIDAKQQAKLEEEAEKDIALFAAVAARNTTKKGPHMGAAPDQRAVLRKLGESDSSVAPAVPIPAADDAEGKKKRRMKVSRFDFIENIFIRLAAKVVPDPDVLRVGIKMVSFGVWAAIILSILGSVGVDTKPLLSLLGLSGLTLGFALKEFIADTLHSFSVLLTHPFCRETVVTIGNFKGKVMSMNLQYLRLYNDVEDAEILVPLTMVYKSPIKIHKNTSRKFT